MSLIQNLKRFCFIILLGMIFQFTLNLHAEEQNRSERIAWEREMANRTEEALEQFLGADRVKVYLKADLSIRQTQRQSHNYNLQSQRAGGTAVSSPSPLGGEGGGEGDVPWLWPDLGKKGNEETFVLPGLKYYGNAPGSGSGAVSGAPVQGKQTSEQTTILPQISVNKLSAIVMVDTKIAEDKMTMVNRIAQTILEVEQRRGDTLQVMRVPFVSVWKKIALSPVMVLEVLKWSGGIGAVMVVGFFLYLGLHRIGRSVIQAANINTSSKQIDMNLTAKAQAALGIMPVGTGGEALEAKHSRPLGLSSFRNGMALEGAGSQRALAHSGSGAGTHMLEVKHFTFINGAKSENIAKIIEDEDINTIAMVLSHLDAERSNAVFGMLPREKQADAALIMAKTDFVDIVQIKTVEKKLKKKLESLVEGREQTVEILSHADNHTRGLILDSIRGKDPALAEKLQKEIFKFEEIAGLTPGEIALVLEGITHEGIAVALRGMSDDFANALVASLPKEAQKALRQWMAIGKPQPLSKVEEVRRRIVDNARRLEHEGRISRHIKPIEREVFGETV